MIHILCRFEHILIYFTKIVLIIMVTGKCYELNYEITKLIWNECQFTKIIFSKHTFSINNNF